jgi:curved DNA-binding protein CbpA
MDMSLSSRYNYYEVLEVNPGAPQHEVTTAYERAKITYSTTNPALYTIFSEAEAREWCNLVEEAYAVIGNKTIRSLYDERLLGSSSKNKEELRYASLLLASKQSNSETKPISPTLKTGSKKNKLIEEEIANTTDWTGAQIKKIREYKELTIDKISEITKVMPFYIQAIEAEDYTNLPALVFVRGYVVQIAKTIGLNDKVVADSYMKMFKKHFEKSA